MRVARSDIRSSCSCECSSDEAAHLLPSSARLSRLRCVRSLLNWAAVIKQQTGLYLPSFSPFKAQRIFSDWIGRCAILRVHSKAKARVVSLNLFQAQARCANFGAEPACSRPFKRLSRAPRFLDNASSVLLLMAQLMVRRKGLIGWLACRRLKSRVRSAHDT
jgi:hypothetical protein